MSVFLVIFFLSTLAFNSPSEATQEKKPPSAVVVGTVYCDTCFQEDFSKTSHFISGATVAVECKDGSASRASFRKEVKTDEHGEFKVHLPFSLSKHVKKIEGCSVTLISSSEPYCAVASTATSSSLHLKSRKQGTHIFSAGFFTFKPLKQPNLCNQKPSIQNSEEAVSLPPTNGLAFPPPIQDPAVPYLPPLPRLPELPPLPQLPPLPGLIPLPPIPGKTINSKPAEPLKEKKEAHPDLLFPPLLPPNPLLPPPLIPNPLQPPPLIPLPKVPELPPLPQLPPLPPIPGKTTNSKPVEPLKDKKEAHPDLFFPPLLPPNPLLPPPLIPLPKVPELPPLPQLPPLPGLVPLPPIPGKTTNSKPAEPLKEKKEAHPDLFFPPLLPPNPLLPPPLIPLPKVPELPPLPQLPPLPGLVPLPPIPEKTTNSKPAEPLKEKKEAHPDLFFPPLLPPNPLLPPPLIPNPLQPPPLIPLPKVPELPPLPQLPPLPGLIPLPPIPGKATNSKPTEPLKDKKEDHPDLFFPPLLPPNPLLPPPLIPNPFQPPPLIPNPFQPPPLIPNPFQPPPAPLIPFPKIPGLTPSPSPPPPLLPFPFPPIFPSPPPSTHIPGIPPASSSKQTSP